MIEALSENLLCVADALLKADYPSHRSRQRVFRIKYLVCILIAFVVRVINFAKVRERGRTSDKVVRGAYGSSS